MVIVSNKLFINRGKDILYSNGKATCGLVFLRRGRRCGDDKEYKEKPSFPVSE